MHIVGHSIAVIIMNIIIIIRIIVIIVMKRDTIYNLLFILQTKKTLYNKTDITITTIILISCFILLLRFGHWLYHINLLINNMCHRYNNHQHNTSTQTKQIPTQNKRGVTVAQKHTPGNRGNVLNFLMVLTPAFLCSIFVW